MRKYKNDRYIKKEILTAYIQCLTCNLSKRIISYSVGCIANMECGHNQLVVPVAKKKKMAKQSRKERLANEAAIKRTIRKTNSRIDKKDKILFANKLRAHMTYTEMIIWPSLQKLGFSAQQIVCGFIPDFWHEAHRVVIEIDGGIHLEKQQRRYDRLKDNILKDNKITVLRFTNTQVIENLEKVMLVIKENLAFHKKLSS